MFNARSLATTLSIAAMVALGPLSTDMYLPALPGIALELLATPGEVQLTLSFFLVGFACAQLVYGPLSDRFGRKPVLLAGLMMFFISTIACALATDIYSLIAFRFLQALGGSVGPVLGRAMVRDIHGAENSGKVLSLIGSVMALAPAIAPIAGGYMTVYWGWPSIFWLLALFCLAVYALLQFKIPETAPAEFRHPVSLRKIASDFSTLLRDRRYLGYTLTCTFSFSGLFAFLSGSSFVIIEYFAIAEKSFGLLFALVVGGYLTGTVIGTKLSHQGHKKLVFIGALITLCSGAAMFLLASGQPQHVISVILPMMCFMIGVGLVMPQSMAGALADYPHLAGSASGLLGFIQMGVAAIVGVFVGHGYDGTPFIMTSMIALMGLLTLVIYGWLLHRN